MYDESRMVGQQGGFGYKQSDAHLNRIGCANEVVGDDEREDICYVIERRPTV